MSDNAKQLIEDCIAEMAVKQSFWGYLFGRISRKPKGYGVGVAMGVYPDSNGAIVLGYNEENIKNTDKSVIKNILEHEGLHILNNHIPRQIRLLRDIDDEYEKYRSQQLWGRAADAAINYQCRFPRQVTINGETVDPVFPDTIGCDVDKASEYYYQRLMRQNKDTCPACGQSHSENSEHENGQDSKQQTDQDSNNSNDSNGSGSDNKVKCPKCGKSVDTVDSHAWSSGNESDPEYFAKKVERKAQKAVRDSIRSYQRNVSRGSMSAFLKQLIDDFLGPPKIPYYQLIASFVRGSIAGKWKKSLTRVNRKRTYCFFDENGQFSSPPFISPFPGRKRDLTYNIVIMIDTSASQSDTDIAEALSGCKNIIESDRYCKCTVLEVDTSINHEYEVDKIHDINFEVTGRGGTVLTPGIQRIKELNPDVGIVFTDGYCEDLSEITNTPKLLFVISPHGSDNSVSNIGYVIFQEKEDD